MFTFIGCRLIGVPGCCVEGHFCADIVCSAYLPKGTSGVSQSDHTFSVYIRKPVRLFKRKVNLSGGAVKAARNRCEYAADSALPKQKCP